MRKLMGAVTVLLAGASMAAGAELTLLDEGDPQSFRVRAYEGAAQAIASQANDLGTLTAAELQKIDGIGKSTAAKIRELLETGHVEKLEQVFQSLDEKAKGKHCDGIAADGYRTLALA